MNTVILTGNLGADAEIREVQGRKVASFSLAVSEYFKNKSGENDTITTWVKCDLWTREAVFPFLKKGTHVAVQGRLRSSKYDKEVGDKEKIKVPMTAYNVLVDSVELLGSKKEESQADEPTDGLPV